MSERIRACQKTGRGVQWIEKSRVKWFFFPKGMDISRKSFSSFTHQKQVKGRRPTRSSDRHFFLFSQPLSTSHTPTPSSSVPSSTTSKPEPPSSRLLQCSDVSVSIKGIRFVTTKNGARVCGPKENSISLNGPQTMMTIFFWLFFIATFGKQWTSFHVPKVLRDGRYSQCLKGSRSSSLFSYDQIMA